MECKKCGNEIQENEKFCGKCGAKVQSEPIKIKFNWLVIGIVAIILIMGLIIFFIQSNNSITGGSQTTSGFFKSKPKWILEIGDEKVFNIDYDEFVSKCKNRLKELSSMNVDTATGGKAYGGKIIYPAGWLILEEEKYSDYVYGNLTFIETTVGRMVLVEEYQGKVKSITYLQKTNSLPNTIAEQAIAELLEDYGVYNGNNLDELQEKLDITDKKFDNAVASMGRYIGGMAYGDTSASYIADAYRQSGSFGYIPYEYSNSEIGYYITLSIK